MNIKQSLALLLCYGLSYSAFATYNGVLEANLPLSSQHTFAGNLLVPLTPAPDGCPSGTLIRYGSCSGSLIDVSSITNDQELINLTQGRLFLTAGHCTIIFGELDGYAPIVHFQNGAIRNQPDANNCRPGPLHGSNDGFHQYKAVAGWTGLSGEYKGLGVGQAKTDWGLVLLDKVVLPEDVSKPAKVAQPNPKLTKNNIPVLGLAGYGIDGWGLKDLLGKPAPIGIIDKMFVQLDTNAVQTTNISSSMNVAQGDQTACNGDSGGGLFLPITPSPEYTIYGLVANGDMQCRATNTSTRVDTAAFRDFVNSKAADIKAAAKANPPSKAAFPK